MKNSISPISPPKGGAELGQSKSRNLVSELGRSLFEDALNSEKYQSSELAYGVVTPTPVAPKEPEPISGKLGEGMKIESNVQDSGTSELALESNESEEIQALPEKEELSETSMSIDESQPDASQETTENSAELEISDLQVDGSDEVLPEFSESTDQSQGNDSSEGEAMASEESTQDGVAEELEVEVEIEVLDEGASLSRLKQKSETTEPTHQVGSPNIDSNPVSDTLTLGKEAFVRATTLQRALNSQTSSASGISSNLDMQEVVDKIAKARGAMSGSRARVVIGEGASRVAMMVSVHDGIVDIQLKASDGALAAALANGSDELSDALSKHGLALGDMASGEKPGNENQMRPREESESGGVDTEVELSTAYSPNRRGVVVVA